MCWLMNGGLNSEIVIRDFAQLFITNFTNSERRQRNGSLKVMMCCIIGQYEIVFDLNSFYRGRIIEE